MPFGGAVRLRCSHGLEPKVATARAPESAAATGLAAPLPRDLNIGTGKLLLVESLAEAGSRTEPRCPVQAQSI